VRWSDARKRYIAETTVGYDARGKRIVRSGSGKTETAALRVMRQRVKDYEAGMVVGSDRYRVREAVEDWLRFGQGQVGEETRSKNRTLCETHIIPKLGERRIRQLRAEEVDLWLEGLAKTLATSTLQLVRSLLSRVVRRAMKRGMVDRNMVELCQPPTGLDGRPSKSLTFEQANDVLTLTEGDPLHCYIVVSLLTGARTEEVRALVWRHVHLDDDPAYLEVWRSVRRGGDTKTTRSRRTLALPAMVVEKMRTHRDAAEKRAREAGNGWDPDALVFGTSEGTEMDAANVRRDFRRALKKVPSVNPEQWTPREMRHSFVSLLSDSGVSIEEIARLVGHKGGSAVTEKVYRKQLRPVIQTGATAMDGLFAASTSSGSNDG